MKIINLLRTMIKRPAADLQSQAMAEVAASAASLGNPSNDAINQLLAAFLNGKGRDARLSEGSVVLSSGITLTAEFLDNVPLDDGSVRTCTLITATHADYFPDGLAEFQHAAGETVEASVLDGFNVWSQMDLVTLEDSLRSDPLDCNMMEMSFPEEDGVSLVRQVILGPTAHRTTAGAREDEEHPFCPCCLFTQSFEAFDELLRTDRFIGIRLFASRDANGEPAADCRVNGEDFPAGVDYLIKYAQSWPQHGFEYRKQYIVIRSAPREAGAGEAQ